MTNVKKSSGKELIMNVDYFDMCGLSHQRGEGLYDEEKIAGLLKKCKSKGFDAVMWRTSVCGKVAYPSKVMTVFDAEYRLSCNSLARVLEKIDPLKVAVKNGHRLGLKVYVWVTLFDSYFTGLEDAFFAKNPHLLMMSRDGTSALRGIPCYACSETRDYRLKEAKELSDYGVDGIFYSMNNHNICVKAQGDMEGDDVFGFNPEVVDEFKKRYGRDIRKERYNKKIFYRLHGEYLTLFLKQVRKCLTKGQQLFVTGGGLEDGDTYYIYGNSKGSNFDSQWQQVRVQVDLREWFAKDLVDRLFIPSFYAKQLPILSKTYGEKVKYAWVQADPGYHAGGEKKVISVIKEHLNRLKKGELNGITFHEVAPFEYGPGFLWKTVSRFR